MKNEAKVTLNGVPLSEDMVEELAPSADADVRGVISGERRKTLYKSPRGEVPTRKMRSGKIKNLDSVQQFQHFLEKAASDKILEEWNFLKIPSRDKLARLWRLYLALPERPFTVETAIEVETKVLAGPPKKGETARSLVMLSQAGLLTRETQVRAGQNRSLYTKNFDITEPEDVANIMVEKNRDMVGYEAHRRQKKNLPKQPEVETGAEPKPPVQLIDPEIMNEEVRQFFAYLVKFRTIFGDDFGFDKFLRLYLADRYGGNNA